MVDREFNNDDNYKPKNIDERPKHPKRSLDFEALALKVIRKHKHFDVPESHAFKSIGKDRWRWNGNIWQPTDFERFRRFVIRILPPTVKGSCRAVDNIIKMLHNITQVDPDQTKWQRAVRSNSDAIHISVQNGVVNLRLTDGKITLDDPNWQDLVTSELPLEYNIKATCPTFDHILRSILPEEEDRYLLQCYTGYCLIPDHRFQCVLLCYGAPNSGKSLIVNHAIGGMFGHELTSNVSLERICKGSDELRKLERTLLNISTELDSRHMEDSSIFNQIACGEAMDVALKYEKGRRLEPNAKHIFASNHLPRWERGSNAQARRIKIVFFPNDFSAQAKDGKLEAAVKLEASGIFNWALQGLIEVASLKQMPNGSAESTFHAKQFRMHNNPLGTFNHRFMDYGKQYRVVTDEYRRLFFAWCGHEGITLRNVDIFKLLKKINPHVRTFGTTVNGEQKRVIQGLQFNDKGEELKKELS